MAGASQPMDGPHPADRDQAVTEWTPARIATWVAPLRTMAVGSREWSAEWHRLMSELMDDMRAQLARQPIGTPDTRK